MKVEIKKKEEAPKKEEAKKEDELPTDDEKSEEGDSLEDVTEGEEGDDEENADDGEEDNKPLSARERKLEIEKAKLEGKIEALEEKKSLTPAQNQRQQQLNAVYSDLSLDDDDFKEKYRGYSKVQILQALNNESQAETNVKIAKLEAKNSLSRKYPDFVEFEDKIDEALADASPAVLQDPDRLKKFMERQYHGYAKDAEKRGALPKPKPKLTKEEPVKRIVKDFQPPTPRNDKSDDSNGNDEIKEEDRALAAKFGIKSETQRKKYMNQFIPMDFGGGIKFEDPKKGFEKVGNSK